MNYYRGQKVTLTEPGGRTVTGRYQGTFGSNYHIVDGQRVKINN